MQLISPSTDLYPSWLEAFREPGLGTGHGMGLHLCDGDLTDLTVSSAVFSSWVSKLKSERTSPLPGFVPATNLWIVEGQQYLGAIQLRHCLGTEYLRTRGGHIGYTVRPSARGRGLATEALRMILPRAKSLGLNQVLVTCAEANEASARVIEKVGGAYESTLDGQRRYWVPTTTRLATGFPLPRGAQPPGS